MNLIYLIIYLPSILFDFIGLGCLTKLTVHVFVFVAHYVSDISMTYVSFKAQFAIVCSERISFALVRLIILQICNPSLCTSGQGSS